MRHGRIQSFRTVMTGELFNLLKEHSVLSDLLAGEVEDGDAFRAGAREGLVARVTFVAVLQDFCDASRGRERPLVCYSYVNQFPLPRPGSG